MKIEKTEIKQTLITINEMIEIDLNLAIRMLNSIPSEIKDYFEEIKYLQNKINEKKLYLDLDEDQKKVYDKAIIEGRKCYHENDLIGAYDYYTYGKHITAHPIFDYYIGKILYKSREDSAYTYLATYASHGGEKLLKALLYLNILNYKNGKLDLIDQNEIRSKKIKSMFNIDFEPFIMSKIGRTNYEKQDSSELSALQEESLNFFDTDIEITEDEFLSKIMEIRELYRKGKVKTANRKLDMLFKSANNSYQKQKLKDLSKSKSLYINQGKFGY